METYFRDIKGKLLQEINNSEFFIYAAVAWITDFQIISTLINRLRQGIKIELIVNDDDTFMRRLNQFDDFRENGGDLFLFKNDKAIMHDKFCVIDLSTTITGSFNWSFNASTIHKENIIIERDNIVVAKSFAREFRDIKKACVLYEGQRTYFELESYAEVKSFVGIGEDEERIIQLIVEEGKKWGFVAFDFSFNFCDLPKPKRLLGYWREKVLNIDGFDSILEGKALYNFDVVDPIYQRFVL